MKRVKGERRISTIETVNDWPAMDEYERIRVRSLERCLLANHRRLAEAIEAARHPDMKWANRLADLAEPCLDPLNEALREITTALEKR